MGKFIAGIVCTLVAGALIAFAVARMGLVDLRADQEVSAFEQKYAMGAMDAATERNAPQQKSPIPPVDANLLEGARLYKENCALCHGSPQDPSSQVGQGLYPRAPQFLKDAPDMPDYQNFYIIKHGVRWTGMPAWGKSMTDVEMWKITLFLSRMEKLPPAVDAAWKSFDATQSSSAPKASPATPAAEGGEMEHHHQHH